MLVTLRRRSASRRHLQQTCTKPRPAAHLTSTGPEVHPDVMATAATPTLKRAASLAELEAKGRVVVHVEGHTVCLLLDDGEVYAVDNRCPHMGFPLHRGTVSDGILTCHWHHARFDL